MTGTSYTTTEGQEGICTSGPIAPIDVIYRIERYQSIKLRTVLTSGYWKRLYGLVVVLVLRDVKLVKWQKTKQPY